MVVERSRQERATSHAGFVMILVGVSALVLAGIGVSAADATQRGSEHGHGHGRCEDNGDSYRNRDGAIAHPNGGSHHEQKCHPTTTTTCSTSTTSTTQPDTTSTTAETTTTTSTVPDTTTSTTTGETTTTTTPGETTTTTTGDTTTTTTGDTTTTTTGDTTTTTTTGNIVGNGTPGGPTGAGAPVVVVGGIDSGSDSLPFTGSPAIVLLGIGAALIASGIGLVVRRRDWAH